MKVLVTGAAGFIGFHLCRRLLGRGDTVVGLDNLNDYYPVVLKEARLAELEKDCAGLAPDAFRFLRLDVSDREALPRLFGAERFDAVVHLAAQAGVRYSVENPWVYVDSNLVGFANILECVRHWPPRHLVYASSSSVYGSNEKTPFSESDRTDEPESLYAVTKKSCELMASCYARLYGIHATGLRFFTVYGPWGRPDMSPMLFADAVSAGEPLRLFNNGEMMRDFTYIDDIIEGLVRVLDKVPPAHEIYNIGCGSPVKLADFISEIEQALGRRAEKRLLPMQPGDVCRTWADTEKLERELGCKPSVGLHEGIRRFIDWYRSDGNPLRK